MDAIPHGLRARAICPVGEWMSLTVNGDAWKLVRLLRFDHRERECNLQRFIQLRHFFVAQLANVIRQP